MKKRREVYRRNVEAREDADREISLPFQIIKALIGAYLTTGLFLVALAFLIVRLNLKENVVSVLIILVYVIATFIGGFIIGRSTKYKKYFWGFVVGLLYVVLLFLITLGVYRTLNNHDFVTTLILCICGGTLGGMLS